MLPVPTISAFIRAPASPLGSGAAASGWNRLQPPPARQPVEAFTHEGGSRDAPAWAAGMVEASAIVEVDFAEGPRIIPAPDMSAFFDRLASCVRERNPDRFRGGMP